MGELRKVAIGIQREKNPKKMGKKKNLGGGLGQPFGENGGKRREKWNEWGACQCVVGCLGRAIGRESEQGRNKKMEREKKSVGHLGMGRKN